MLTDKIERTQIVNPFISDLTQYIKLLDKEVIILHEEIKKSKDPVSEGLCDSAEYLIGAGFTAIQKYILEICLFKKLKKDEFIDSGSKIKSNITFLRAIWTGANYWKHDAEWWEDAVKMSEKDLNGIMALKTTGPEKGLAKKNLEIISEFGEFGRDFICSNILAKICKKEILNLEELLPRLEIWLREAVEAQTLTHNHPASNLT